MFTLLNSRIKCVNIKTSQINTKTNSGAYSSGVIWNLTKKAKSYYPLHPRTSLKHIHNSLLERRKKQFHNTVDNHQIN